MGGGCEGVRLRGFIGVCVGYLVDGHIGHGMDGSQGWIASPFRVWICGQPISMTRFTLCFGAKGTLLSLAAPWKSLPLLPWTMLLTISNVLLRRRRLSQSGRSPKHHFSRYRALTTTKKRRSRCLFPKSSFHKKDRHPIPTKPPPSHVRGRLA